MKLLSGTKKKQRQINALKRLKNQLETEGHPLKYYKEHNIEEFYKQEKRIKKEIEILKSRI